MENEIYNEMNYFSIIRGGHLPFLPFKGDIRFNYNGMGQENFINEEKYELFCAENNIIPYSKIIMQTRMGYKYIDIQDEHLKDFFEGKKINTYLFKIQHGQSEESISQITNNIVPKLFNKNYELYEAKLDFFMGQEKMPEPGLNHFPAATLKIK